MPSLYDQAVTTIDGRETTLADYAGRVLLIVNTASRCGFTPQYEALEALYRRFGPDRFAVLGFPCNQFGGQEPGGDEAIASFCANTYQVSFPMFAKIDVNGAKAHPLYKRLKSERSGVLGSESIKWNFTKFLVDRDGHVVERYGSTTKPQAITEAIEKLLHR